MGKRVNAVENDFYAVGKCRFAVEVGGLAVEIDLKTVDLEGIAVAFAGPAVGNGRSAVEKDGSAVGKDADTVPGRWLLLGDARLDLGGEGGGGELDEGAGGTCVVDFPLAI
jgi:hypothetical protein